MRSETGYLSEKQYLSSQSESKERVSNITNDSENLRLSDFSEDGKQVENGAQIRNSFESRRFFQQRVQQQQITPSMHKKAINWLITFCWTRNYHDEVLWYSVGYFYSYSYSRMIRKDRLTLILISAINLAVKLFQPDRVMNFQTMKSLLNNVWATEEFGMVEGEFLETFDFNMYFPTVLGDIMAMGHTSEEKGKVLFLAQSLFMNSYELAINDIILEDILYVANTPDSEHEIRSETQKLFKGAKLMEIIKQKYASKFDVDGFLEKLLKQK